MPILDRFSREALAELPWDAITMWAFIGLGFVLSAMMLSWPYQNSCSWGLWFYLAAVGLVLVTGVYSTKLTWQARSSTAHVLALGIVAWGVALALAEILPRVGYAKAAAVWTCV